MTSRTAGLHWRAALRALFGVASPSDGLTPSADWRRGWDAGYAAGRQQRDLAAAVERLR